MKCADMDMYKKIGTETKKIIINESREMYCSVYPFTNKQFIEFMNSYREELEERVETYYLYNIYNKSLPIVEKNMKYVCREGYEEHPVCGVNWIVAKEIATMLGGRLPYKYEMDFLTSNIPSGKKINTKEMFGGTNRVDLLAPDAFGVYDICGNVSEWCEDANPENDMEKVAYGVSWNNDYSGEIMTYRYKWKHIGAVSLGFRIIFDK